MIALDTHAWVWYVSEDQHLPRRARARIDREKALGVHPVSCWEVAMLCLRGHLKFRIPAEDWVQAALARPGMELLTFLPSAAVRAAGLGGGFPDDPADRFIVATALELQIPLVTRDERIAAWGRIETIWA